MSYPPSVTPSLSLTGMGQNASLLVMNMLYLPYIYPTYPHPSPSTAEDASQGGVPYDGLHELHSTLGADNNNNHTSNPYFIEVSYSRNNQQWQTVEHLVICLIACPFSRHSSKHQALMFFLPIKQKFQFWEKEQQDFVLKDIKQIAQESVTVVNIGKIPMKVGDGAKIKSPSKSKEFIPPPPNIIHTLYCNVGYGDLTAPGRIKYVLVLVDRKSCYCWVYSLKGISGDDIRSAFCKFKICAGRLPKLLYTKSDKKIIKGSCKEYLKNDVGVSAAPLDQQSQNGFVEWTWQTLCNMTWAYLTDMRMPK
eukprot:15365571-Ditylum_brightwellii.AAC.2